MSQKRIGTMRKKVTIYEENMNSREVNSTLNTEALKMLIYRRTDPKSWKHNQMQLSLKDWD